MDDPVNVEVVKATKDWWLDIWILDLRIRRNEDEKQKFLSNYI